MVPQKYKSIFSRMRNLKIKDSDIVDVSEPGLFRENTSCLFVGINPGSLKPLKVEADQYIEDKNISNDELHYWYEKAQESWHFYTFITDITRWETSSILNIVHFPTKFNNQPSLRAIKACEPLLIEAIKAINPRYIIAVGNLPYERLNVMNLGIPIIKAKHYAYLLRKGEVFYKKEIKRIKEELNKQHGYF